MGDRGLRALAAAVFAFAVPLTTPVIAAAHGGDHSAITRPTPRGSGGHRDALVVRFASSTSHSSAAASLARAGANQVGEIEQLNTVVLTAAAGHSRSAVRQALESDPSVLSVESDVVGHLTLTPDDRYWWKEWYARKVHSNRAWNVTTGAQGPVVAILDSGVQASQPDLIGRVMAGRDFVNNDASPADDMGHGTMVAGVVAGRGNNVKGIAGTCWGCRLLPVKVADREGDVSFADAAAGLVWATDHGARIVNMSFGQTFGSSLMAAAVDYALNHRVILVAAAGNEGNRAKFYPAGYPGVLSVAATDQYDHLYPWSTRGTWVKLAAPGCAWTTKKGTNWGELCGTSAASPVVAGVAGLILAYKPYATAWQVEGAIKSTAVSISANVACGRVDADAAVRKFVKSGGG